MEKYWGTKAWKVLERKGQKVLERRTGKYKTRDTRLLAGRFLYFIVGSSTSSPVPVLHRQSQYFSVSRSTSAEPQKGRLS
jgi:hypothetical protein